MVGGSFFGQWFGRWLGLCFEKGIPTAWTQRVDGRLDLLAGRRQSQKICHHFNTPLAFEDCPLIAHKQRRQAELGGDLPAAQVSLNTMVDHHFKRDFARRHARHPHIEDISKNQDNQRIAHVLDHGLQIEVGGGVFPAPVCISGIAAFNHLADFPIRFGPTRLRRVEIFPNCKTHNLSVFHV